MLNKEEFKRYLKQVMLDDIGLEGQNTLKNARVAVVGAGGLGCPVLQYLNSTGIGTLGIIDFDVVEESNLHRQVLYGQAHIGQKKAETASRQLAAQNPHTVFEVHHVLLNEENVSEILSAYDVIVDGCDNFATRYVVNDACVHLEKPLIYGSILGYNGQIAGFNINGSKNLRDLFEEAPNPEDVPSCSENGVLATVPGIIGLLMAQFTIDVILKRFLFQDKFIVFNTSTMDRTILSIS